jgi:PAS domain S-box-containing protein
MSNDKRIKQGTKSPEQIIPKSKLRKKAELKLQGVDRKPRELSHEETEKLIHELQVHQIELEMQNEELRTAQEELEASHSKYVNLYDFAPSGYFTFDKNGIILDVNLAGAVLLFKEKTFLTGKPFSQYIHRDDQDIFFLHRREVIETKHQQTCEIRIKSDSSAQIHVRLVSIPFTDKKNSNIQIRSAVINITEQKKAEEGLKARDRQQAAVTELGQRALKAPDLSELMDMAVNMVSQTLNVEYVKILELIPVENNFLLIAGVGWKNGLVGREVVDAGTHSQCGYTLLCNEPVIVDDMNAETRFTSSPLLRNHNIVSGISVLIQGENGPFGTLSAHSTRRRYFSRDDINFMSSIANILAETIKRKKVEKELEKHRARLQELVEERTSELRKTYKQLQTEVKAKLNFQAEALRSAHLASLGELAAGVAHEINNPINGIINYSRIIANRNDLESKEHEIASRIIKEGDRIANIVKSLLSFARESKEEKRPVHVYEILSDSLALTEAQLRKDGIKLKVNVSSDLPAIFAQPQQIEQVFLNIISNARYALNKKYPESNGDKRLEILGNEVQVNNAPFIQISFSDHGTGIPARIMSKIKNPFFSTKPVNEGTGLGLSISHGIISDHGGKIAFESVKDEFTRVMVNLPVHNT